MRTSALDVASRRTSCLHSIVSRNIFQRELSLCHAARQDATQAKKGKIQKFDWLYVARDVGIIFSRHQKIFLQKRLSHKGYPLYGTEPFLDRFLGEGA